MSKDVKAIERFAYDLGFDGFGIAGPGTEEAVEHYTRWLDLKYDGEMGYMRRWLEKRSDLSKVLPGVKSVICLRKNYLTAEKDMSFADKKDVGDISLYALNEDYHDVLKPMLKRLEDKIRQEFEGCQTRLYTDTGPVLEKPLAQKAGLGWIGKHTNLLTGSHSVGADQNPDSRPDVSKYSSTLGKPSPRVAGGSWFFLSEILVDVALPPSEEAVDRCGTCQECIDICPTQAIVAPYVLDARKCISYLTIELKGVIPVEFRKALGNRIFGCDDCQIVCPWNSYAVKIEDNSFQERSGSRILIDLMRLDEEGFRSRFRKSPVKRLKRRGLLRNVAVALGNSGNPDSVAPLVDALADIEPLIRSHAVWALGELLGEQAVRIFTERLCEEKEEIVLEEIGRVKSLFNLSRSKE